MLCGDIDWLCEVFVVVVGLEMFSIDLILLLKVQIILCQGKWIIIGVIYVDVLMVLMLMVFWLDEKWVVYGFVVDIGLIIIVVYFCNFQNGCIVFLVGIFNLQICFGEDLMLWVFYVQMNLSKLLDLVKVVCEVINVFVGKLVGDVGVECGDVFDVIFVGNLVMYYFFLGIDFVELGGVLFVFVVFDVMVLNVCDFDLDFNFGVWVYMLLCIVGYVGVDVVVVIFFESFYMFDEIMFLVDVGMNVEIVLGNKKCLFVVFLLIGFVFEGVEIFFGQCVVLGVIECICIDKDMLEFCYKVIGVDEWFDEEGFVEKVESVGVIGICGLGIIEVVVEMYFVGFIIEDGVIDGVMVEKIYCV